VRNANQKSAAVGSYDNHHFEIKLDVAFLQQSLYLSVVFLLGQLLDVVKSPYYFILDVWHIIIPTRR